MGAFSDLVKSLIGSRDSLQPSGQAFPPIDVDGLSARLRLTARGEDDGRLNEPPTASHFESSAELDVVAEIERHARTADAAYRAELGLYAGRIRGASASADQRAAIEAAGEKALADFRVQAIDYRSQVDTALHECQGLNRELEAFRREHRRKRLPKIVSNRERIFRWLVLGTIVIFEAILNGTFFAEGSRAGLIGGLLQALVLSALNVGLAVSYAFYGWPRVSHVRLSTRFVGVLATALYLVAAVALNLFIGHYRDLFITLDGRVAAADLSQALFSAPLTFRDGQSLILVMLGIGLSAASAIDAAGMDDPYLEYGELGRSHEAAERIYTDHKAYCLADLAKRRDEGTAEMRRVVEGLQHAASEVQLALDGRFQLHDNYRQYLRALAGSHEQLQQLYREANVRARSAPPPARFLRRPEVPSNLSELPPLENVEDGAESIKRAIERVMYFAGALNRQFEEEAQLEKAPPRKLYRLETVGGVVGRSDRADADG